MKIKDLFFKVEHKSFKTKKTLSLKMHFCVIMKRAILNNTMKFFSHTSIKCLLLNTSTLWSNHFYVFVPRIRFCYSIVCGLMTYPHFQTYFRSEDQFDLWPSINKSLLIFAFYIRKEKKYQKYLYWFFVLAHTSTSIQP